TMVEDDASRSKVARFAWFVFGAAFGIFFAFLATGFAPRLGKKDEAPSPKPVPVATIAAAPTTPAQPVVAPPAQQPVAAAPVPGPVMIAPPTTRFPVAPMVAARRVPRTQQVAVVRAAPPRPAITAPVFTPRVQRPAPPVVRRAPPPPKTDSDEVPSTRSAA